MEYLLCHKCGSDLISTKKDIWVCPKCGTEYSVDDKSIVEVNKFGERVKTPEHPIPIKEPYSPKYSALFYVLSFFSPIVGLILGAILWNVKGMRRVAKTCIKIGLFMIAITVVLFAFLWIVYS